MNGIIGFSEMIATEKLEESESKHYANIIINSGQRLLTIVDDILDISRIETGQIEIYPEAVNIDDLLKEVINFFTPRARSAGLDLQLLQTPGTDVFCLTDKTRLHQILSNLISNSFKFTQKGFVAVSCEKSDKNLLFSVRDSGIGIDPSMHEKIFERFIQEEMEPTREYGGTGLGLAISKKLTELLGGNIWLESEKGKGSIFYFTIPLEPVERPPTKKKAVVGFSNNNESIEINILVAEDDDTNFEYLDEILKKSGYGVIRASTGEEAVKIATTVSGIALVLMDIKMPVMDGYTATREIKKLKPDLPVIAQTAYAMTKDSMKAREAGCDSYIAKPILRKDLLDLLSKYLKK